MIISSKSVIYKEIKKLLKEFSFDTGSVLKYGYERFKQQYNENLKFDTFKRYVAFVKKNEFPKDEKIQKKILKKMGKLKLNRMKEKCKLTEEEFVSIERIDLKNTAFKRMIILSDLHCGHRLGLTPPSWAYKEDSVFTIEAKIQRESWNWYVSVINEIIGPRCDVLVVNGDAIDGDSFKNGGTELITTNRIEQAEMVVDCLKVWEYDKLFMVRGTPYHVGKIEQFEDVVASKMGCYITDNLNLIFNGKTFNFTHKIGGTSVFYSKATQVVKAAIANELMSNQYGDRKADVVVRSHLHYYTEYRDSNRIALVTPGLQVSSRFGRQQCSNQVGNDFGFVVVDVFDNGFISVMPYLATLGCKKVDYINV